MKWPRLVNDARVSFSAVIQILQAFLAVFVSHSKIPELMVGLRTISIVFLGSPVYPTLKKSFYRITWDTSP